MVLKDLGYTLIFLGGLVFVHELGHFLVAKALNVKVLKFSIGFGPRVFGFVKGETEYRLSWIPLGGYVKMAGELPSDELPPEEAKRGFLAQPPWKRGLIVVAGPVFNLIFPVLVYFAVFLGPQKVAGPRIGNFDADLSAVNVQLQTGDRILAVDGQPVETWGQLCERVGERKGDFNLTVERDGKQSTARATQKAPKAAAPESPCGALWATQYRKPPLLGVPEGSAAAQAGLATFDRVLSVNGQKVEDELDLRTKLDESASPVRVEVARVSPLPQVGGAMGKVEVRTAEVAKVDGKGLAAIGAERVDLYVASVVPGSPAEKAGIRRGDRLLELNGQALSSFDGFHFMLGRFGDDPFDLKWRSGGAEKVQRLKRDWLDLNDEFKTTQKLVGIQQQLPFPERLEPIEIVVLRRTVGQAFVDAVEIVPQITVETAALIGKLFTRDVPLKTVGGPGMLFDIARKTAERGLEHFLSAMAVLSINLGLMNLLPIPVLDGFHLLSAIWEGVRRRPIPMRVREVANLVGLALLAVLMVRVLFNDITRFMR